MFILTISVSNSNDPTCDRLKLTKHFEVDLVVDPTDFIREAITYCESLHKEIFPRRMSYNIPYTEVEINPTDESEDRFLLKTAYNSGQLQGTMIGERIEKHFGVPYNHPSMDTRPDVPLLSESLGGYSPGEEDAITDRMDADARRRADAKALEEHEPTRHTGRERTYPVDKPSGRPRDESYVVDES